MKSFAHDFGKGFDVALQAPGVAAQRAERGCAQCQLVGLGDGQDFFDAHAIFFGAVHNALVGQHIGQVRAVGGEVRELATVRQAIADAAVLFALFGDRAQRIEGGRVVAGASDEVGHGCVRQVFG